MPPTEYDFSKECPDFDLAQYTGVTQDSRAVKHGFIFAALKGQSHNGVDFIPNAIEQGATLILCDEDVQTEKLNINQPQKSVRVIQTAKPRQTFAHMAAALYRHKQPENIVAVTGTNGKSSVVDFIKQLWDALGTQSTTIGTLSHTHTTPDPVALHKALYGMEERRITHLAMEASSHGIDQYRMDGATVKTAAITNITQDHLDYHKTMENYKEAKLKLFTRILKKDGTAILNADTPEYAEIKQACESRGIKTMSYGKNGQNIKIENIDITDQAQNVTFDINAKPRNVTIPLVGTFQIMNLACALACVIAEHPQDQARTSKIVKALNTIKPVRGRLEYVASDDGNCHAYVDYAHTPNALETVLKALRAHTKGKLICVFGCGGDRDKAKRPLMGEIAATLADIVIITDDNPRSENPEEIREQIISGIANQNKIHDIGSRDMAIQRAVATLSPNDILLIAGKGHEQGQTFKNQTHPFDDVTHCRQAFSMRQSVQSLPL